MTSYRLSVPAWGESITQGQMVDAPDPREAARQWAKANHDLRDRFTALDVLVVDPIGRRDRLHIEVRAGPAFFVTPRFR